MSSKLEKKQRITTDSQMTKPSNPKSAVRYMRITEDFGGQRLDNFLHTLLKGMPKSAVYKIIRKGEVRINRGRAKPHYRIKTQDLLRIPPVNPQDFAQPEIKLVSKSLQGVLKAAILFEDEGIIVLNKPAHLAVHGGSGIRLGLIEALRSLRTDCPYLELVHRLDLETSGCLMVAKKRSYLRRLHHQLRERTVQKTYHLLSMGRWRTEGTKRIALPLLKTVLASGERFVRVDNSGKVSSTLFQTVRVFTNCTLLQARPSTGRTHQIRVHAQAARHPIIGDSKYASAEENKQFSKWGVKRLFLHASAITIDHPTKGELTFHAALPDEMARFLAHQQEVSEQ